MNSVSPTLTNRRKRKMKNYAIITAVLLASGFWVLESVIHFTLFGDPFELIPHDPNEAWMRIAIVLLILLFGLVMSLHEKKLIHKEQEKFHIFKATVRSSQHVLNNHLNQMQYFMLRAKDAGLVDDELIKLYEESIDESSLLLRQLSEVETPEQQQIEEAVQPWKKAQTGEKHVEKKSLRSPESPPQESITGMAAS